MVFILLIVIGLVAWALHLMEEAAQQREFSLMLAGFLVSVAAAGLVAVYFLMNHYVGYMTQSEHNFAALKASYGYTDMPIEWYVEPDLEGAIATDLYPDFPSKRSNP